MINSIKMKKLACFVSLLLTAAAVLAQTPHQILTRMEEEMGKHQGEGMAITVDLKMPVLGTISTRTITCGEKMRMETSVRKNKVVVWSDGKTNWTYNAKTNEVEIKNSSRESKSKKKRGSDDAKMFTGIADGYDVSIQKETADAWYILCTKSKDNKDEDDPKTMDVVVTKGTFYPKSLSTKMSGMTMTLRDISYGITEEQVSFRPEDFPGVRIVDKRE